MDQNTPQQLNRTGRDAPGRRDSDHPMQTWQSKLGLIIPSLNTVMEYELQQMAGRAMSIHTSRISAVSERNSPADREAHLLWMETQMPAAAMLLAHAHVDVICYGCTGGGVISGVGHDREICQTIENMTGIRATTTIESVTKALQQLRVRRVSVASPYEGWLNQKLRDFMEKSGFEVMAIDGIGTREHASVTPERVAELACSVDRPEAEAIVISCTNFRTLEIIEPLEQRLGKPVITSNSASMWEMLRVLADPRTIAGAGRLLRDA